MPGLAQTSSAPFPYLALEINNGSGEWPVMKFDFMVQTRDSVITLVNDSVPLPNSSAVWPLIARLAYNIDEPGSLILVANESGEVVIRIGVACARSLAKGQPEAGAS